MGGAATAIFGASAGEGLAIDWSVGGTTDWDALHSLLTECYAPMAGRIDPPSSMTTTTPADLATRARDDVLMLGTAAGRPVACGFLAIGDAAVEMGKLAVAPGWRRRGLLRAMVAVAGDVAGHAGLGWIDLHVRAALAENRRTYRALGFAVIAANCHPGHVRPTSLHLRRPV